MYPNMVHEEVIYQNPFLCMRIWRIQDVRSNNRCPWHYHKEVEFLLVEQGELTVQIADDEFVVGAGDVVLFGSREPHATRVTSNGPVQYIVLQLDLQQHLDQSTVSNMKVFSEVVRPLSKLNYIFRENPQAKERIILDIQEIHEEMERKEAGYELAVSARIKNMLLVLLRSDKRNQLHDYDDPLIERISPALAFIERHLSDKITIEDMTRQVNLSYYYFVKVFKKAVGMSFTDYVNFKRIKRAEQLLLTENLSMMEVADRVGISNLGHFYEMFKRINGCSPKQFQNRLQSSMNGGEQV